MKPSAGQSRLSRRRFRRVRRGLSTLLVGAIVVAVLGYAFGELVVSRIVRSKLQSLVADQLNARLDMGQLHYAWPYGVVIDQATLSTTPPPGEPAITLASFKQLKLHLSEIPLKRGPLQIERIDLLQPTVHLVRTDSGFGGETPLRKRPRVKSDQPKPNPELSKWFRLRQVNIENGRIEFDDLRKSNVVPMVWERLNIELNSQPQTDGVSHAYDFTARQGEVATITSRGVLNLQTLILDVQGLRIDTYVAPHAEHSALPVQVQRVLRQLKIAGQSTLDVQARIPLRAVKQSEVSGTLEVANARGKVPGWPNPVDDFDGVMEGTITDGTLTARINYLTLRSQGTALTIQPVDQLIVNGRTKRWSCSPIRAALAYMPAEQPHNDKQPPPPLRQQITLSILARPTQQGDLKGADVSLAGTTASLAGWSGGTLAIDGSVGYFDRRLEIRPTSIVGLGGRIETSAAVDARTRAVQGRLDVSNVDLAALHALLQPTGQKRFTGLISGQFNGGFHSGSLQTLAGEGRFRIEDGHFAEVPLLGALAQSLQLADGLFVARNASGRFTVADRIAHFERVAVSTTGMRLRGTGDLGFDRQVYFTVFADTLSNWEQEVKSTQVPILSDIGGAVAGGTQGMIEVMSRQLTTLRITGTYQQPTITPVPLSLITGDAIGALGSED